MHHSNQVATFFANPKPYLQRSYNIRLRAEIVQEMLGEQVVLDILDIGCGDGSLSLPLLRAHNRLTLLDLSSEMLAIARSNIPEPQAPAVRLINADLMTVNLPAEAFDLILCMGVLSHVDSPANCIARICSLLKPGGSLIVTVSSGESLFGRLRRTYVRIRDFVSPPPYCLKWFSPRKVLQMFHNEGVSLRKSYRYNFPSPGMDRLLSNERLYRNIRKRYGDVAHNKRAWLGSEFILCLRKEPVKSETRVAVLSEQSGGRSQVGPG